MAFNPNALTFADGVKRLQEAARAAGIPAGSIITSRDEHVEQAVKDLAVTNIPNGFNKWQLPVYQDGPTQFFMSFGNPGTEVPPHSHDEGDGFRIIISGSIIYNRTELHAGDWMFIPKGQKYDFRVGDKGVGLFYCYQCCCA